MKITNETKVLSSLAGKQNPMGAAIHNTGYEHLGLNFIYIPLTVQDCKHAIEGIKALNFVGTTVSMPHKQEVMKYLDNIDPIAQEIGAVNTVSNNDGILTGYNSDWIGAMTALKEVTLLEGKKVILLGAGGAARAIAYGLKHNKAQVTIFNRTPSKAKALADVFGHKAGGSLDEVKDHDYDILINATPVGYSVDLDKSAIDDKYIKEGKVVMDVVITPPMTPLLKIAKQKNCKTVSGYKMLIYQAMFQFELFAQQKPQFEVLEEALLKMLWTAYQK